MVDFPLPFRPMRSVTQDVSVAFGANERCCLPKEGRSATTSLIKTFDTQSPPRSTLERSGIGGAIVNRHCSFTFGSGLAAQQQAQSSDHLRMMPIVDAFQRLPHLPPINIPNHPPSQRPLSHRNGRCPRRTKNLWRQAKPLFGCRERILLIAYDAFRHYALGVLGALTVGHC